MTAAATTDTRILLADAALAATLAGERVAASEYDVALDLASTARRRIDDVMPILRALAGQTEARR